MVAVEYERFLLGLIFYKAISDVFEANYDDIYVRTIPARRLNKHWPGD